MSKSLQVQSRSTSTRSDLKKLRNNGWVPGVLYGRNFDSMPIQVNRAELASWLRKQSRHAIFNVTIDGREQIDALIHDLQIDPLDRQVLHIDLQQIQKGQPINATIPIQFVGQSVGIKEGGILQQQLTEIEVRALPEHLPTTLWVSIEHLGIGDQLRVRDLLLPENVELRSDGDDIVVSIVRPKLDPVEVEETLTHPAMVEVTSDDIKEQGKH